MNHFNRTVNYTDRIQALISSNAESILHGRPTFICRRSLLITVRFQSRSHLRMIGLSLFVVCVYMRISIHVGPNSRIVSFRSVYFLHELHNEIHYNIVPA